jgi:hypothetical protein
MTVRAVCYTIHKAFSPSCKAKPRRVLPFRSSCGGMEPTAQNLRVASIMMLRWSASRVSEPPASASLPRQRASRVSEPPASAGGGQTRLPPLTREARFLCIFRKSRILPLPDYRSRAIMNIHLGRAAPAAPVKEILRITDRIAPAKPKKQRFEKNALPFFPASDQDMVAQASSPLSGAAIEEGTHSLRHGARMDPKAS